MNYEPETILQHARCSDNEHVVKTLQLYDGITASFLSLKNDRFTLERTAWDHMLEIHYCQAGRIGWKMNSGSSVYLGPKDFSLHTAQTYANSQITLPNGFYKGLTLHIDLQKLIDNPPEPLASTEIIGTLLSKKFCQNNTILSFAGNEQSEAIFRPFYHQPPKFQLAYRKLKALELLLYLCRLNHTAGQRLTEYQSEQIETIRQIHEHLMQNLDQRATIETLSKQYLMNPTTLKTVFKSVYGTSIAAHMKEHRMEQAAKMLTESNQSIAEIATAVGYDSQSKFSAAFKDYFHILPKEYRKNR